MTYNKLSLYCLVTITLLVMGQAEGQSFWYISKYIKDSAKDYDMLAYAFKIGDYNTEVVENYPDGKGENMTLDYNDDTIAFTFLFDRSRMSNDQADEKMALLAEQIRNKFPSYNQVFYHPNELQPETRLPYVHVQTAGNVAGGAYYYQAKQVIDPPHYWDNKTVYGVSISDSYRITTTFSGTIVFDGLECSRLGPRPPIDVYRTKEEKIMLLNYVNYICRVWSP